MRGTFVDSARLGLLLWTAAATGPAGCDFFEELESAESAETGETEGGSTTGTGGGEPTEGDPSCSFPADDRCVDQDRLRACDPHEEQEIEWDCAEVCGSLINFTCLGVGNGQHACWCAEPGTQKVLSCTELEVCLRDCDGAPDTLCADQCFARTTATTVRMLGALVHCAHDGCHETCIDEPESCASCIETAMTEGATGCALERSVCDGDRNDEPGWP